MKSFISVCIPTYNGQKYLKETLDSVFIQTYKDFEIVIVDDQSTDDTYALALEYAQKDNRIRLFQNETNLGLVGNWNRCIELAKGEWIKFVFQDDLINDDCLEKMMASVKDNDTIIFCRRNFIFDDSVTENKKQWFLNHSQIISELYFNLFDISPETYSEIVLRNIGLNIVGEPTVVMLRRSAFHSFGLFNSNLIQICDHEFWTRIATNLGIKHIPVELATFRVHANATTTRNYQFRNYHANFLDTTIILNDLVFHPIYSNLRSIAFNLSPSIDLTLLLRTSARTAWLQAIRNSEPSLLNEWNKISETYPAIKLMASRTYLQEFSEYVKSKKMSVKHRLKHFKRFIK